MYKDLFGGKIQVVVPDEDDDLYDEDKDVDDDAIIEDNYD